MIILIVALLVPASMFLFMPKLNAYFLILLLFVGSIGSVTSTMAKTGVKKPRYPSRISVRTFSNRYKPYIAPAVDMTSGGGSDYDSYGYGGSTGSSGRGHYGGGLSGGK